MTISWDKYFSGLAEFVAQKSKDRSTKVGAVILGPDREIRSTGYNGFPRGVNDDVEDRHDRPKKYFFAEHAERNAIFQAVRVGTPLDGCTIYVTHPPCADCARGIIQAGIREVIIPIPDEDILSRWGDSFQISREMFAEASVELRYTDG